MLGDVGEEEFDDDEGAYKSSDETDGEQSPFVRRKRKVGFDEVESGGGEHGGDRQEERKFDDSFALETECEAAHDGSTGAGDAGDHGEALEEADLEGGVVVDVFYFGGLVNYFNDINNNTADEEGEGHDEVVTDQNVFDESIGEEADDGSWQESDGEQAEIIWEIREDLAPI